MKSAYELAMERLSRERGPVRKLSDAQKEVIQDIERRYDARIAETRLEFEGRLRAVQSAADHDQVMAEMAAAIRALEEKRDRDKEAVWNEA